MNKSYSNSMRKLISRFSHHLYKKNHKRFLKHNSINASDYSSFLKLSFEKSYSRFSPINYLPGNDFQSYKVLYNFISLNSLAEISGKTFSGLSEAYNWDLKYKIRIKNRIKAT